MKIVKWKGFFYEVIEELPNSVLIKTPFLEAAEHFTVPIEEVEAAEDEWLAVWEAE